MKISVIIPSYNSLATIDAAVRSVREQSHRDIELIVMDGGSTDGTREWLEKNGAQIDHWESKRDEGTTDALNQGFQRSTGELVTFLCTDDRLHDSGVLSHVVEEFTADRDLSVLCGSLEVIDPRGEVKTFVSYSRPELLHRRMSVHLPGSFFRREILKERQFARTVEIANDYELFAYLVREKRPKMKVADRPTVTFSLGGRTNNPETDFWKARECLAIRRQYYGELSAWPRFFYDLAVSSLRWMGFRPLSWMRRLGRTLRCAA